MCCLPSGKKERCNATGCDAEDDFASGSEAMTNCVIDICFSSTSTTAEKENTFNTCEDGVDNAFISFSLFRDCLNILHVLLEGV